MLVYTPLYSGHWRFSWNRKRIRCTSKAVYVRIFITESVHRSIAIHWRRKQLIVGGGGGAKL